MRSINAVAWRALPLRIQALGIERQIRGIGKTKRAVRVQTSQPRPPTQPILRLLTTTIIGINYNSFII